jgi:hypothetical protein
MSEFNINCKESIGTECYHDFIVVDWSYEPSGHSHEHYHPHTKQARRLLCQRCFAIVDLGMIEKARTDLLSTE